MTPGAPEGPVAGHGGVTPTRLRAARPDELPAVLALWSRATAPSPTDDLESLGRLLQHDPGSLIVADVEGELVGSVVAGWDGWRGAVHRLAVHPAHRRTGLGRRLLAAAEDHLAAAGAARLHCIVMAGDEAATAFWRGSGWQEQSDRVRFTRG